MKKIIITLFALATLGLGAGTYMFNKTLDDTSSLDTDYEMDAQSLLAAFEENENDANQLYLDKVIQIEGVVNKTESKDGKLTIYFNTDNPLSNIIFQLEQPKEEIKIGDQITLKGICTGYLLDVVLVRAVIV